jgi:hypothetical protein
MALLRDLDVTSQKTYWSLRAVATGANLTGLDPTGLICAYTKISATAGDAVTTFTCQAHDNPTCNWESMHACEMKDTGGATTNTRGFIRVDFPDAAFSSPVDMTVLSCSYGATSFTEHKEVQFRVPVNTVAFSASTTAANNLSATSNTIELSSVSTSRSVSSFDASSLSSSTDDNYNGRVAIFRTGLLINQALSIVDYIGSSKTVITSAATSVPATNATFVIV